MLESPDGDSYGYQDSIWVCLDGTWAINTFEHSTHDSEAIMNGSIGAASNYSPVHHHTGHSAHPPSGHWRLASRLELGPLPSAVPCARLHAKHIFREWGLAHIADDAELVISELMTNALNAAKLPQGRQPITLQLLVSREYLMIQVWDALTAAPAPRPHAIDSETGRGLEIESV